MNQRPGGFSVLPEVIKNLMIINALFFVANYIMLATTNNQTNLNDLLGLYNPSSPHFRPYQIVTHMFMHSSQDIFHLAFNMFSLWMFGSALENYWGGKRFLIYYMLSGIGAGLLYTLFNYIQATFFIGPDLIEIYGISEKGLNEMVQSGNNWSETPLLASYLGSINRGMVGASGAIYGILMAFGMMFSESKIHLYFLIPIKAKYFVAGLGAIQLLNAIQNDPNNNIAHVAHLSGMLIGYILIKYWQQKNKR